MQSQEKATAEQPNPKRWLCLFVLALMPFMSVIDANIINVALPTLAKTFQASMATVEWVTTIYLIFICATIIIYGRLGDIISKSLIFIIGLSLFTLGSLLCGISNSIQTLIAARVIQALGAAGAMATSQGLVTEIFPANERGRALGISGMAVSLGAMAGAPLGGLIISIANWHYIFFINIPIGVLAIVLSILVLPKEKKQKNVRLDYTGSILYFVMISLLLITLNASQAVDNPWLMAGGIAIFLVLFVLFILVERRVSNPLVDITIFQNALFSLSVVCSFMMFLAISGINIIQPFYLQDIRGISVGITGLFMLIFPIVGVVVSPTSGYLSDKIGSEILTFIGLLITAVGLIGFGILGEHTSYFFVCVCIVVASFGNSMFQTPNTSLVMSTVSRDKLGVAGSINGLVRNLGMVMGILFSTSILFQRMSAQLGYKVFGVPQGQPGVFIGGMHWAYAFSVVICIAGAVLTGIRLKGKKRAGAGLPKQ